jgi:hypothetical protein
MEPCPQGWQAVTLEQAGVACEPWSADARPSCPEGEVRFPGEAECGLLGASCQGMWPQDLPTDRPVVYVREGATNGDGSQDAPFGSIDAALQGADPGAVIALAKGTYDEPVELGERVALRGVCPGQTRITHSAGGDAPATVTVRGTGVRIRDVQVGGAQAGVLVDDGAQARLDRVRVEGATEAGVRVHNGATLTASRLVIRDVQIDPDDEMSAFGLVVEFGEAQAEVEQLRIEGATPSALVVDGEGSRLVVRDAWLGPPAPAGPQTQFGLGAAASVQRGATGVFERVLVHDSRTAAFTSMGRTDLQLRRAVVRRTTAPNPEVFGFGVLVGADEARATLSKVWFDGTARGGVHVNRGQASADLTDVIVDGARNSPEGNLGQGVFVGSDATVEARRLAVRNAPGGVGVDGSGGTATVRDGVFGWTEPIPDDLLGFGFDALSGGVLTLERAAVHGAGLAGVAALDGGRIEAQDLTVTDVVEPASTPGIARGLIVEAGGVLKVQRGRVARVQSSGVTVFDGDSRLEASNVLVEDMQPSTGDVLAGVGVAFDVQAGGTMELTRCASRAALGLGAIVTAESTLRASELRIMDVQPATTGGEFARAEGDLGRALDVQEGATATIEGLQVERAREVAVIVSTGATLEASEVLVKDTRSVATDRTGGLGLSAVAGGVARIDGASFVGSRQNGVAVYGDGSELRLRGVQVRDTREAACTEGCPAGAGGIGLGSYTGGVLDAQDFLVTASALAGVQVGPRGQMDLREGTVSSSPIGANIQAESYEIGRLSEQVAYKENDTNLDSRTLPVPGAPDSLDFQQEGGN